MRLDFLLPLVVIAAVACGGDDDDASDDDGGGGDASMDAGGTIPDGGGSDAGEPDAAPGMDGGATGEKCGFPVELKCDEKHYCEWDDDSCGGYGTPGHCVLRPTECEPVKPQACGCDGNAYENACQAHKAGTDVAQLSICTPVPGAD